MGAGLWSPLGSVPPAASLSARVDRGPARAVRADAPDIGVRRDVVAAWRSPASAASTVAEWRRAAAVLAGRRSPLTLLAPLVWYALRGRFAEFWGGWWIYGELPERRPRPQPVRPVRAGLGPGVRLLPDLAAVGGRHRRRRRRSPSRGGRSCRRPNGRSALGVAAWLLAAWVELALAQRYSSHYFSILALPTWLAAATAVADLARPRSPRTIRAALRAALPLVVVVAVHVHEHRGRVPRRHRRRRRLHRRRRPRRRPPSRRVRDREDRAGDDRPRQPAGDPLLAWTERPWTYLQWDRIAATRYVWGSFLLGQIYLGAAGPQFVPPHTAEWFADDLAQTDPQVFVEEVDHPVPPDSLVGEVVAADFMLRSTRVPPSGSTCATPSPTARRPPTAG